MRHFIDISYRIQFFFDATLHPLFFLFFFRRRSYPARADSEGRDKPIRFAVRSLGWTEIAEEDLTPERSSKAVNKCIVDLSLGRNDLLDVVGRWGDVGIDRVNPIPMRDGKDY